MKRKGAWTEGDAPEKRTHMDGKDDVGGAEGDLDLEAQAARQDRSRQGRVVTAGFESDDSDGEQNDTHRKHWAEGGGTHAGGTDADGDDMFGADNGVGDDVEATRERKFLQLGDIEGQEFGAHTAAPDAEVADVEDDLHNEDDPDYDLERVSADDDVQDANADAERTPPASDNDEDDADDAARRAGVKKQGMGFRLEQFNMKAEMASGQIDEEGNYVRNKTDPFAQNDRWLEGHYSRKQIKAASDAHRRRTELEAQRSRRDEEELPTAPHAMRELAPLLHPGESVLDALRRISADAKQMRKAGGARASEATARLDLLTRLTTTLMSDFGQINLYDDTYESIVRQVRRAGLVDGEWDPSRPRGEGARRDAEDAEDAADARWEYKWTPGHLATMAQAAGGSVDPETKVFGPFSPTELCSWADGGFFGAHRENIVLRKARTSDAWAKWEDAGVERYLVGQDLANNRYYELPSPSGSQDPRHTRRVMKWATWKQPSDYNPREVPIQWDFWMRHTRRAPPTIEELVQDAERQRVVQHNSRILAARDREAHELRLRARETEHARALEEATTARKADDGQAGAKDSVSSATIQPASRRR
ncbi:hypothetical protein MSPP1_000672 [Malassezia sp. CBS 17886]|nr:hypothetical protein MSPP1_000672 [Malassezia sp. CBS 17886]